MCVCVLYLFLFSPLTLSYQTQQLMSQIQTQLEGVTAERDQAWSELSRVREEAEQNATALQNLQNVLEHFQRGYYLCICVQ